MIEELTGEHWTIKVGDVRETIKTVASNSVHVVKTSPPYWSQRNYGYANQIGLEPTVEEFVQTLVEVFREVKRCLRDDGVLFVNLGDSYTAGKRTGHGTRQGYKQGTNRASAAKVDQVRPNAVDLAQGNKIGVPWRVALAMQADGWILRQDIIWHKPAPMPESITGHRWVRCRKKTKNGTPNPSHHGIDVNGYKSHSGDIRNVPTRPEYEECPGCAKCQETGGYVLRKGAWRPTTSHEYVFMFSKSKSYFADGDGSKEPCSGNAHSRGNGLNPKSATVDDSGSRRLQSKQNASFSTAINEIVETRNIRSVWRIVAEGFKGQHFAVFPTELVRRCLITTVSPGGCCAKCGKQFAPIVRTDRKATRPGNDSKVGRASARPDSPYENHNGSIVGNRDPKRHTTITAIDGYRASCRCDAGVSRPVVMDCFAGVATTGRVAINMGCDFIGLEGSAEYAKLGAEQIIRPWSPKSAKKSGKRVKVNLVKQLLKQLHLSYDLEEKK